MNKRINGFIVFIFVLLTSFLSINVKDVHEEWNKTHEVLTKSITYDSLSEDVEELTFIANLKDKTLTYDVTFKTNDFDGVQVRSLYYYHMHDVSDTNETIILNQYERVPFEGSTSIVEDRIAHNTVLYEQAFNGEDGYRWVASMNGGLRINLEYEKDGAFTTASSIPQEFYVFETTPPFEVDDTKTVMGINDDKTYAELDFSFTHTERTVLDSVYLKSHTDSELNQKLYLNGENENSVWQGDNTMSFELIQDYHYQDLYIEYTFSDLDVGVYTWQSDIVNDMNFQSGIIETTWDKGTIIFLIIILILILLMIIFIVLIFMQMQKRRKMKKQQDQAYYDENYEDGMNY